MRQALLPSLALLTLLAGSCGSGFNETISEPPPGDDDDLFGGVLQPSSQYAGANLTCTATMFFNVGGLTPGSTNSFTLQIMDSVGTFSNVWPINDALAQ